MHIKGHAWLLRFKATEVRLAVGLCMKLLSCVGSFWAFISQVLQDLLLQTDSSVQSVTCGPRRSWSGVFSSVQLFSSTEEAQNFRDDRLNHQDFRWCLISLICCLGEGPFPPKMIALLLQPLCFLFKVPYFLQISATVLRSSQLFLLSLPLFRPHTEILRDYYQTETHILASPCAEHLKLP